MGQGTESYDRPTEVSVIRFVSRNRTVEEIAPKKELYTCKQHGCGKIFSNLDEYKTHEALEALKIRFICREPGCGEELSDPGSMWRHYQELHNNETHVFSCPYTGCGSLHATSDNLEEHIELCHRQPPTLPTEPEIICLEGPENVIDDEITKNSEDSFYENELHGSRTENYKKENNGFVLKSNDFLIENENYCLKTEVFSDECSSQNDSSNRIDAKFPKNEDLLITEDNFLARQENSRAVNLTDPLEIESAADKNNIVFSNSEVTITKSVKNETSSVPRYSHQEHRIDMGNLEKVFRSGFERDSPSTIETNSNCSDDEEYTPKKQRMSRYKQESYKCEVNGCGKMYKYISHYRHHQDSHKLMTNAVNNDPAKQPKPKQEKASTVSFFLCKMPGCGAEVTNVTGLWKHYQDNHANSKPPAAQTSKSIEIFRCKVQSCEMEFNTTLALYKHFNEVHTNNSNANANGNSKTGNGSSLRFIEQTFPDDATARQTNFKTDIKANNKTNKNTNDRVESNDDPAFTLSIKEESEN